VLLARKAEKKLAKKVGRCVGMMRSMYLRTDAPSNRSVLNYDCVNKRSPKSLLSICSLCSVEHGSVSSVSMTSYPV